MTAGNFPHVPMTTTNRRVTNLCTILLPKQTSWTMTMLHHVCDMFFRELCLNHSQMVQTDGEKSAQMDIEIST